MQVLFLIPVSFFPFFLRPRALASLHANQQELCQSKQFHQITQQVTVTCKKLSKWGLSFSKMVSALSRQDRLCSTLNSCKIQSDSTSDLNSKVIQIVCRRCSNTPHPTRVRGLPLYWTGVPGKWGENAPPMTMWIKTRCMQHSGRLQPLSCGHFPEALQKTKRSQNQKHGI